MTDAAATLHPLDPDLVARYLAALAGELPAATLAPAAPAWGERLVERAGRGYAEAQRGREAGANAVTLGLAHLLATAHPTFYLPGAAFSFWEARIDRGLGMLLRPPSRLFAEAGLATAAARAMPIRLDAAGGAMGGAFVPARLVPRLKAHLVERETRLLRRLVEAELDAVPLYALLLEAAAYAADRGLGLYEAIDAIVPEAPQAAPPGALILAPDRKRLDPALRKRLETAAQPAKQPGLLARLRQRLGDRS